ncbi:serine/Arginine-related protein 53 [Cinclus cinclus]|uniref:serine/Arginine-related protein 53 n=1 Tax=Cinclus cinclus TaxID=127875 RepID=UPI002E0DEF38
MTSHNGALISRARFGTGGGIGVYSEPVTRESVAIGSESRCPRAGSRSRGAFSIPGASGTGGFGVTDPLRAAVPARSPPPAGGHGAGGTRRWVAALVAVSGTAQTALRGFCIRRGQRDPDITQAPLLPMTRGASRRSPRDPDPCPGLTPAPTPARPAWALSGAPHRWLGARRGRLAALGCGLALPARRPGRRWARTGAAAAPPGSPRCIRRWPKVLKMGRRSSDTEEESRSRRKKKHRRRSSSSSSSDSRSYSRKKSGRKSRSRSRSRDLQSWSHSYEKRRRHRSSSSSSYGSRRKRSRSRGRGKSYRSQRSRSKSRTRRSRQRSYSRSSERSGHRRTPSGSRERRKGRDKDKDKAKDKGKGKEKEICGTKAGDSANIKAGLEHLTPAEQAKARLQLVLEAAAKADEALKAKERSEEEAKRRKEEDQAALLDQARRVKEIEAIESDAFVPQTFRSSKEIKKSTEPPEPQPEPANLGAGATEAAAPEKDSPAASIPTAIKYQDDNSLAHPNLFIQKAEAEEKWFQRLVALRQERLMGSPVA